MLHILCLLLACGNFAGAAHLRISEFVIILQHMPVTAWYGLEVFDTSFMLQAPLLHMQLLCRAWTGIE